MDTLKFNLNDKGEKFKVLNATNGGPWYKRHAPNDQKRSNFENYKKARIPYSRNHDSAIHQIYGGPHSHDITMIFPDFNADPENPDSYDFACTDEAIMVCLDAGTETFFRLGQTIEHLIKKYGSFPPKDFKKWAVICEHIIRHYNYGWANGFKFNIEYWEIWNEPDLDEGSDDKRTWGGTKAQFFDFYEIAAKHLKSCFPELKIGGPANAGREDWAEDFLKEMKKRNVPLDFFSWHIYCVEPAEMLGRAERFRKMLDDNGYKNTESILNEWNYVKGWSDEYVYSLKAIHGMKGAAFTMACISAAQRAQSIDMLMYYDTRPSVFCGAFDFYTAEPLKGYYPFYWYGMFYDMEAEIRSDTSIENIYSLCGVSENGKSLAVITHYTDNDNSATKQVKIDFMRNSNYEIYLLDNEHDGELVAETSELEFTLEPNTCILIKEI